MGVAVEFERRKQIGAIGNWESIVGADFLVMDTDWEWDIWGLYLESVCR